MPDSGSVDGVKLSVCHGVRGPVEQGTGLCSVREKGHATKTVLGMEMTMQKK